MSLVREDRYFVRIPLVRFHHKRSIEWVLEAAHFRATARGKRQKVTWAKRPDPHLCPWLVQDTDQKPARRDEEHIVRGSE
jgi:hypothetical protein